MQYKIVTTLVDLALHETDVTNVFAPEIPVVMSCRAKEVLEYWLIDVKPCR